MTPDVPVLAASRSQPSAAWASLARWVRLYSWAQVGFLVCLVVGAHAFPLAGQSWSTCRSAATGLVDARCVLVFHLYEVPLAALFAYHAYVGFTRFTRAHLPTYTCLTTFQLVLLFVFATFESSGMFGALARGAPTHELVIVLFAFVGMIGGSVLGFYTVFGRLLPELFRSEHAVGA